MFGGSCSGLQEHGIRRLRCEALRLLMQASHLSSSQQSKLYGLMLLLPPLLLCVLIGRALSSIKTSETIKQTYPSALPKFLVRRGQMQRSAKKMRMGCTFTYCPFAFIFVSGSRCAPYHKKFKELLVLLKRLTQLRWEITLDITLHR